jgi:hypothetical protein
LIHSRPAVALVLVLVFAGCRDREEAKPGVAPAALVEAAAPSPATLYFPNDEGNLGSVATEAPSEPVELRIQSLVTALIAGPPGDAVGLFPILPKDTAVAGVLLVDGVAYVDLHSQDGVPPPGVGSADERMILYSLIDTVVLNTSTVERVVVLWNGSQRETFAGHFDTTRPLAADRDLVQPAQ